MVLKEDYLRGCWRIVVSSAHVVGPLAGTIMSRLPPLDLSSYRLSSALHVLQLIILPSRLDIAVSYSRPLQMDPSCGHYAALLAFPLSVSFEPPSVRELVMLVLGGVLSPPKRSVA